MNRNKLLIFFAGALLGVLFASTSVMAFSTPLSIEVMQVEQQKNISAQIPQLTGGMPAALLVKTNEALRQVVFDRFRMYEEGTTEIRALATFPESMKKHLFFRAGFNIERNDGIILSLTQSIQQYTGGAHGMYWRYGYVMNARTGEKLSLPDVFIPGTKWAERLEQRVRSDNGLWLDRFKGVGPQSHYFLDDKGLTLYFQLYEIAPYVAGIIELKFSYEELRGFLRPEYIP